MGKNESYDRALKNYNFPFVAILSIDYRKMMNFDHTVHEKQQPEKDIKSV